ncbi:MAG: thioether cross-link-forming SCIFF peptide maturase [Oscillospiraceae bacterium]|nr:thioether cross-link-forming SCIFF peptide maturase [Oscillospiraceae bacterium]
MVHTFEALGLKLALDTGSGALHQLDGIAFDALNPDPVERARLLSRYPEREAEAVARELDELRESGALDSPDDYDASLLSEPGTVKAMCLHAAHDCNLRCRYCFAHDGTYRDPSRARMSVEVGKAALDWLISKSGSRRALEADFFGGEPLLNLPAVKEIVAYGRERERGTGKRFSFTITTNAIGLTDGAIRFINEEMDNCVLSLDGRREVHDRMRPDAGGHGSYDRALEGALRLIEGRGGKSYYARGTFTAFNLDFTNDALALADAGFEHVSVEPVVASQDEPYALRPEHLPQILDEYDKLAEAYVRRRREGRPFSFFHFNVDLENGPCLRKRLTGCGAGNEYVAVTPEGRLYPCHQFVGRDGWEIGDATTGAFDSDMQRVFASNHVLNKPDCRACWAKYFCSGGCCANALAMNGRLDKPYELGCAMQRKRLELALAVAAIGL